MFIVFEGIDGSGKTSLCNLVADRLQLLSIGCEVTSEFGRKDGWSQSGREKLMAARNQQEELHIVMNTRCTHQENVLSPALRDGKVVLMDRYLMSTIAYQSSTTISQAWLIGRHKALGMPVPDKVFFLSIPPHVAMHRVRTRGAHNRFDMRPDSFFEAAAKAYSASIPAITAEGWDITVLDAQSPLGVMADEVVTQIVNMMAKAA